jgi:hypothetical protein
VAAIACLLPVPARLRWDVLVAGFVAIPAEHPVAAAADPASRDHAHHEWTEVRGHGHRPADGGTDGESPELRPSVFAPSR